jgi:hypothetical protein
MSTAVANAAASEPNAIAGGGQEVGCRGQDPPTTIRTRTQPDLGVNIPVGAEDIKHRQEQQTQPDLGLSSGVQGTSTA